MKLPRRLRHGEEATLAEHLDELRARLIVCLVTITLTSSVAFAFHHRLVRWLEQPLPPARRKLITFGVAEPFTTSLKVSVLVGVAVAFPIILHQLWSFLAPALEERTQRIVAGFSAFSGVLLAGGMAFGYWLALPAALHVLTNFDKQLYNIQIRANDYLNFAFLVLIAMGVVFELPIFVVALVRIGILTTQKLRRTRRIGYFIVLVIAVALPGVDPITTTLEAIPLFILYELSIWLAVLLERRSRPVAAPALRSADDA
jgi:sec-independent protein translocase protein TatC